jgi:hypothetical protein
MRKSMGTPAMKDLEPGRHRSGVGVGYLRRREAVNDGRTV